ncbi:MAG TPA: penicillin-binding protein activator LpoB [Gammaproteobacteria bacterium]|jgi:hypothetical protein
MKSLKLSIVSASLLLALTGCATTPKVQRISADQVTDVSGYWNDTDANLTSQEMVNQMLGEPWLPTFQGANGGKAPTVIVGQITNLSSEHISTSTFIDDIQRQLINSGKVQFVAGKDQRSEVRDERKDQDLNATSGTRSAMGQEVGADYMMQGTINTIIDADGNTSVKYYQVDLRLINMHDNLITWVGQKKIKKIVQQSGSRF